MTAGVGAGDLRQRSMAERANDALLALGTLADRERSEAELNAISAACDRAEQLSQRLGMMRRVGAELDSLGVAFTMPPPSATVTKAVTRLRAAATRAADTSHGLTDRLRGSAVQEALKSGESLAKRAEHALLEAAEVERHRIKPRDLDDPVPTMPGHESRQVRANRIRDSLSKRFNGSVEGIPEVIECWRREAVEWAGISETARAAVAELPVEIKTFVEAAATPDGAPWSMVTPAVRDWLDGNGRGDGYGVHKW